MGRLLKQAQAEAFVNEGKCIPDPGVVMDKLAAEVSVVTPYPQLGPNTPPEDFEEALFVRSRLSTTLCDIVPFRGPRIKEEFKDGAWTKIIGDDGFSTVKQMSPAGKKMQSAIAKSIKEADTRRKAEEHFTRPSEEDKDDFYRRANHTIRELNIFSKTLESQLQYARNTMSAMFDNIETEKELVFREPSTST